jgi:transcriptional regulator with XRE-family HTH domain
MMRYIFEMPAQAPAANDPAVQHDLTRLGDLVRARRKSMRIPAGTVARAANMSRQTLFRIEEGEPSVTIGAYLNALRALGLELAVRDNAQSSRSGGKVAAAELADYPQLKLLAWHRPGATLTEPEALAIYERNWRHIDRESLGQAERDFIAYLVKRHGEGALLV